MNQLNKTVSGVVMIAASFALAANVCAATEWKCRALL